MTVHAALPQDSDGPVGRQAADMLGTPTLTEMACRRAGVELVLSGAESCERTGLSARVRKGGAMPPELAEAVRRHRVGLIARLLSREPVTGDVPEVLAARLRKGRDGGVTLGDLWSAESLLSQAKAGHRCARLYPLLDADVLVSGEDGAVIGTLLQAMAGEAMVLVAGDPPVHPSGDKSKPAYVPAQFVLVERVWPTAPGTVPRPRGPWGRPHDGEFDAFTASSITGEGGRP